MFCPQITDAFDYDENLIEVTKYDVLGSLPNPFLMENGEIADTPQKWEQRRREIYKTAVELQYGTIPPKPEVFEVETLYGMSNSESPFQQANSYKITAGTREKQLSFYMKVIRPKSETPCPVVVNGDMCFLYHFNPEYLDVFRNNKIAFATFDRTLLAHDINNEGRSKGALYDIYPEYTFGAVGAWAWGYMRCVDALEVLGIDDMNLIAFSGHSRGGKTAMLAGALDERAAVVAPNSTCAGGCGCYRIHLSAITEGGSERSSETLDDIIRQFPFWFSEELAEYRNKEEELPFDSHFLKALVAPRALVVTESASDIWANPVGSYMTTMGAKEVYKMLGAEDKLFWSFRKGYHFHKIEDIEMLANVISVLRDGAPVSERFFKTPFKRPEPIFDWKNPNE